MYTIRQYLTYFLFAAVMGLTSVAVSNASASEVIGSRSSSDVALSVKVHPRVSVYGGRRYGGRYYRHPRARGYYYPRYYRPSYRYRYYHYPYRYRYYRSPYYRNYYHNPNWYYYPRGGVRFYIGG